MKNRTATTFLTNRVKYFSAIYFLVLLVASFIALYPVYVLLCVGAFSFFAISFINISKNIERIWYVIISILALGVFSGSLERIFMLPFGWIYGLLFIYVYAIGLIVLLAKGAKFRIQFTFLELAILIFFMYLVIELFNPNQTNFLGGIFKLRHYIVGIPLFFITAKLTRNHKQILILFWVTSILGTFVALYGFMQKIAGLDMLIPDMSKYAGLQDSISGIYYDAVTGKNFFRLPSTFKNFVFLSQYMVLAITINISLFLAERYNYKVKFYLVISTTMMLFILFHTFNLSYLFCLSIIAVIFSVFSGKKKKFGRIFLLLLIFCLVFYVFNKISNDILIKRIKNSLDFSSSVTTLSGRIRDWQRSINIFLEHPIFGSGLGSMSGLETDITLKRLGLTSSIKNSFRADSLLLIMLLELGLVGVGLFFLPFLIALFRGWRIKGKLKDAFCKNTSLLIIAYIIATLIVSTSNSSVEAIPMGAYLWIFLAILVNMNKVEESIIDHTRSLP